MAGLQENLKISAAANVRVEEYDLNISASDFAEKVAEKIDAPIVDSKEK
jgi:hypothetical protein